MTKLVGVPKENLPDIWTRVAPWISNACALSKGRWTSTTVAKELAASTWQLWLMLEENEIIGIVCTSIYIYGTGLKACGITLLSGDTVQNWNDAIDILTQWAKEQGCKIIEGDGRGGLVKSRKGPGVSLRACLELEL